MIIEFLKEISGYNDFRRAAKMSNSISADEDGLWLDDDKKKIGWDDIVFIQKVEGDEEENEAVTCYQVTLRGGLPFCGLNRDGTIEEFLDSPTAELADHTTFNAEDTSRSNLKYLMRTLNDLGFSNGVATWLREIGPLPGMVLEEEWLRQMSAWQCIIADVKDRLKSKDAVSQYQREEDALCESIQEQLTRVDFSAESSTVVGVALFQLAYRMSNDKNRGVSDQVRQFDLYHAAFLHWSDMGVDCCVESLIPDDDEKYPPFGNVAWKNDRKMIVCTDERPDHRAVAKGKHVKGIMIMSQDILEAYNAQCERSCRLVFETSHPRNGFAYIQNPLNQSEYFEASSYKKNLLDLKFAELCRLLTCLGATKISASVESEKSATRTHLKRSNISGSANYSGAKGSVNVATDHEDAEDNALYQKYAKSFVLRPVGKPHVPKNLLFYAGEPSWRSLAESVLEGRIVEAAVDMTFKDDSVFSRRRIREINAEIQSLIPGYVIGGGVGISTEERVEGKDKNSLVWHYNVTFHPTKNETKCGRGVSRLSRG